MSYMTDERRMIQQTARDFAMNEVLPIANKLDPEQGDIPMSLRDKLAEMGYFGVVIPEEYGGLGLGAFEYVLITEELARAWMSVASIIARGNGLGGGFTAAQRREYLPRMARGEFLGAAALSEPDAGSDLANVSCKATRDGDGWMLNGTKTWCTFADGADFISVLARTKQPSDPRRRHEGISQFLVLKERGKFPPGLTGSPIRKIGYFGWKTWELHFDNLQAAGRRACSAASAKIAARARDSTAPSADSKWRACILRRARSGSRAAGSKTRWHTRRSASHSASRSENSRRFDSSWPRWRPRSKRRASLPTSSPTEVDSKRRCDKEASMAKLFASEMAERVTSQALQIHGGYGYTKDFPLERYWRDARLTKIFEGTSEIQLRIISDRLLPKVRK